MIISAQNRFVYFHISRTGGISTSQMLYRFLGGAFHPPLHGMETPKQVESFRRVVMVRHPLERVLSLWYYNCRTPDDQRLRRGRKHDRFNGMEFDDYVQLVLSGYAPSHYNPQYAMMPQTTQLDHIGLREDDLVLRFEELPGCLMAVPGMEGRLLARMPHRNASGRSYRPKLTPAVKKYVERDMEELGYGAA